MSALEWLALILCVGLALYLCVALMRPELFD